MKKEFYTGQPLIIKKTGERATFVYDDGDYDKTCLVLIEGGHLRHDYYNYDDLEPSTEFKFSELMAGLEQGYFEVGTIFQAEGKLFYVDCTALYGYGLKEGEHTGYVNARIGANLINSTWTLVEPCKEMTLEEIEAELGYKIKLKENSDKPLPMDWI